MRHAVVSLLVVSSLVSYAQLEAQALRGTQASRSLTVPTFRLQILSRDSVREWQPPGLRLSLNQANSVDGRQPHISRPIAGGLVGAVVGGTVGGFIAVLWAVKESREEGNSDPDVLYLGFAFLAGLALGEPWGAACGVHIGNRRQGKPLPSIVASVAVAAAGIGAAAVVDEWRILLAVPVVQIGAAVAIERSTAKGTPRQSGLCGPFDSSQRRSNVTVVPLQDGRLGIGTSVRF